MTDSPADSFGERIRQARLAKALTLPQLASVVGVSRVTAWQWETDKVVPRPATLERLAAALGVPPAELAAARSHRSEIAQIVAECRSRISRALGLHLDEVTITISLGPQRRFEREDVSAISPPHK